VLKRVKQIPAFRVVKGVGGAPYHGGPQTRGLIEKRLKVEKPSLVKTHQGNCTENGNKKQE